MSSQAEHPVPLLVVLGGTGAAGRAVVVEALSRGLRVRVVSRRMPSAARRIRQTEYVQADIRTGAGLIAAFAGATTIIDTTNGLRARDQTPLTRGPAVVAAAARVVHVHRLVLLSIIDVDR